MRIQFPDRILLKWYRKHRRPLPWREDPAFYKVWVSEMMLQQTQVKNVLPYYERFIRKFPHLKTLARATESEVLGVWSGLGYYARARNMLQAARIVLKKFSGRLPTTFNELIKLPGIGPYTAGAILSIAHDIPTPILDGNVRRVLSRFFLVRPEKRLWKISNSLVLKAAAGQMRPSEFNQSLMELGALVCLPLHPLCDACPLSRRCAAKKEHLQFAYPKVSKKLQTVHQSFAFAFLSRAGAFNGQEAKHSRLLGQSKEFLIHQRHRRQKWLKGLWELPMVPLIAKAGVTIEPALLQKVSKQFSQKMGCRVQMNKWLGQFSHTITHHRLKISVFEGKSAALNADNNPAYRWTTASEIKKFPCSSMLRKSLALRAN